MRDGIVKMKAHTHAKCWRRRGQEQIYRVTRDHVYAVDIVPSDHVHDAPEIDRIARREGLFFQRSTHRQFHPRAWPVERYFTWAMDEDDARAGVIARPRKSVTESDHPDRHPGTKQQQRARHRRSASET
jgi:hypothetical protein